MGYSLQLTKLVLTIASCNKLPENSSLNALKQKDLGKNLENNFRNIFSFFFPLGGAKGFLEIVGFALATKNPQDSKLQFLAPVLAAIYRNGNSQFVLIIFTRIAPAKKRLVARKSEVRLQTAPST